MGAFAAVLTRSLRPDPSVVDRMLAASPHRGTEISHHACGLAILGASNHADRVDSTIASSGESAAVFSGRLRNVRELTKTLTDAGFPPTSSDPAEILLCACRAFGHAAAANRLRGEFAAVVTDGRRLWCIRDHLGIKPLFYRDEPRAFFAATEVKQVLAGAQLNREPDLEVLEQMFYARAPEDMPSAYKGVSRLRKSAILAVLPDRAAAPEVYWHPDRLLETARISPDEVEPRFVELFEQAVARGLTGSDIVSLSGGIDSPAVAGFAAPLYRTLTDKPLAALSMIFPDHPKVDERPYIETVTRQLGMTLYTHRLKARAVDDLEQWCKVFDGPIPTLNAPQLLEFYREASRLGFTNVLTGELAEPVIDLRAHLTGHLFLHGRWRALSGLLRTQRRQGASLRQLAQQLGSPLVPGGFANWYLTFRGLDAPQRIPNWLDKNKVRELPFRRDLMAPARRRWLSLQTLPLQGCSITMEAGDMCAAIGGVTVARPFGDIDLWEFFLGLPAEIKHPDLKSKTLIRRLLRGRVPDTILDRRDKTVFNDHVMSQIDYPLLRRHIVSSKYRMIGVDYAALADRLNRQDFTLYDWIWINDLVRIHVFMNQW
jgi:asparagine synthase (glutamine-hydrolysing)